MRRHSRVKSLQKSIALVAVGTAGVWSVAALTARATAELSVGHGASSEPPIAMASPAPTPSVAAARPLRAARPAAQPSRRLDAARSAALESSREAVNERATRRARAQRELALLTRQDPKSFLAVFDLISEQRGGTKELAPLRLVTARYISARSAVLQRMQARFIENPDADHGRELEELARLGSEFRRELDWYAHQVPDVSNLDEILATTTLKLPSFIGDE